MRRAWDWFINKSWAVIIASFSPMLAMIAMCDRCNIGMACLIGLFTTWGVLATIIWLDDKIGG